jgi:hypothetical protein
MRSATRWVAAAWLLGVSIMATGQTRAADDAKPKVGDKFPDVKVKATQAELVKPGATELSIGDFKGKYVVIAFYPKALTGG